MLVEAPTHKRLGLFLCFFVFGFPALFSFVLGCKRRCACRSRVRFPTTLALLSKKREMAPLLHTDTLSTTPRKRKKGEETRIKEKTDEGKHTQKKRSLANLSAAENRE